MTLLILKSNKHEKSKEKAFKQVVSLIKKANNFNGETNIKIISPDFDDLTIPIKTNVPFTGGAKRLVQLKLKDLKDFEKNTSRTLSTKKIYVGVVMTFKNDFKIETIKDEETSFKYNDLAIVTFEEDSKYIDKFTKALETLM